jgi:hypothetical protein
MPIRPSDRDKIRVKTSERQVVEAWETDSGIFILLMSAEIIIWKIN